MGRHAKNEVGNKYGKLTVLERYVYGSGERKKDAMWVCECNCGKRHISSGKNLRRGNCSACKVCKFLTGEESSFRQLLNQYVQNAKNYGRVFELSEDRFRELVKQSCYYCGREPSSVYKRGREAKLADNSFLLYNGIDRMNNSLGYTKENSITCCGICNSAKSDRDIRDFIDWIKVVYEYRAKDC